MSYSLIGKIVDIKNKKVLCEADFDFLKNLNEYRYSRDLGGIEPTGTPVEDMEDITVSKYNEVSPLNGGWYRVEDFEKAKPNCEKELKTYRDKLTKLYEIKNDTVKWYNEMSSDARMEISDDIDCFEEMAIDYEWKIWALNKVINILEFFGENVIFDEDNDCSFGTPVVLYLYVS